MPENRKMNPIPIHPGADCIPGRNDWEEAGIDFECIYCLYKRGYEC